VLYMPLTPRPEEQFKSQRGNELSLACGRKHVGGGRHGSVVKWGRAALVHHVEDYAVKKRQKIENHASVLLS